jgi:putative membrane protein
LTALALLPLLLGRALLWARYSAYSIDNGLVAVRSGWLNRDWRFAETHKLQALALAQSPFDRRHGMATLHLDTIGASSRAPALTLRYLPEDEAHRVFRELSSQVAVPTPAGTITLARTAASAAPAP